MNKKQIQSEATRQKFINKLAEIIRNGNADNFNIRGLCSELGFSPRTFYLYFESKEHAINQCYIFQEETFVEKVNIINKDITDPWKRLLNIFQVAFTFSEQEIITVQRRLISVLRAYDHYIHSTENKFYQFVRREIDSCTESGIMNLTVDNERYAWELIMFYRGMIYNYLAGHLHYPLLDEGPQMLEHYAKSFIKKTDEI